ncbi:hypothetical protein BGX21_007996 [Mortierella sp. AD011]|nr:hypothetical protein BGX20_009751 [Mortierella sp. AD010]KAF9398270.1 hypothetical protein BGX21_007996 [Mortierella sp. AD011]
MEGEGNASALSTKDSAHVDYQYFRSNGSLVRIKVTHNRELNLKYVFWSDLRICFPGIVRVQHGDVVLTFMRNKDENRLKPFRIEYIPGEILDVIHNSPPPSRHGAGSGRSSTSFSVSSDRSISVDNNPLEDNPVYGTTASGETRRVSKSSLVNRNRDELSQMDDSKLASLISLAAKEVLAEKALAAFLTAPHSKEPTQSQVQPQQQQQQQRQKQKQHDIAEPSAIEPTLSSSSSLEFSNDSEYDVVDKHSEDLDSAEEKAPLTIIRTADSTDGRNSALASSSMVEKKTNASTDVAANSISNIENIRSHEGSNNTAEPIDDRNPTIQLHPRDKPDISVIRSLMPPDGADEETKTEFERLRRAMIFCFNLFCSFLKSTTERQLLQSDRRCQVLVRTLKDVNERTPQDHVLRHQLELMKRDTVRTRTLFRKMRSEFLQSKADQITGVHFGVFQHLEQKLFIILPESDSPDDGFRLHFLCECCQITRLNPNSDSKGRDEKSAKKDKISPPHQIHLSKHEGYKLRYTEEFVARYGYHMWTLLLMFLHGYNDHGVTIPPLVRGSDLFKKIMISINYIETEADSGDLDGSWDFSRVSEFYVPVSVSKEGSVGSLFRIITKEGYAKWVCFEHYRERFPENDYRILQKTLKTFFYNEALGAVLVSLGSCEEANEFYEAIVKATNLQELGMELNWDASEQDIKALQEALPRTTAVSIKIFVMYERHIVDDAMAATFKDHTRGVDIQNPDYALGHYKTNLIRQIIDDRRIQAFYLDIIDHSDHPDYEESLNLRLRNTTSFENWNPDKTNPALCDMIRTAGPDASTKISFNTPTLERGFFFMNNAVKPDNGLVMLKAMVNSREQVSDRGGGGDAHKSIRIQQWTSNVLKFANKLEGLWLDIRTPQDTETLQQLIEMNPHLRKLKVTTETNIFYKIYEAVQKAVVVWKHKVPMKLVLKGGKDMTLTWSELVVPPERKQDQVISLEYSAGASNINRVLMFFGYMITHLKCLDFTNLDVKTLEACTRSRGSNIMHLEVNILGLSKKGLEDLAKIVYRSLAPMSQLSSRFSIHLCPVEGVRPDWVKITEFVEMMGPKVDELVIYSSDMDSTAFEVFLERITPKKLPLLESLIVNGTVGMLNYGPVGKFLDNISAGSITSLAAAMSAAGMLEQSLKNHPPTTNPKDKSQFSRRFLPWLRSFVSELPLQKLGLNKVFLETEDWRSVLSKINFSELQILDLKDSMMTMAMLYELPSHLPKYDRFLTKPSPMASCCVDQKPVVWAPFGSITIGALNGLTYLEQYYRDLSRGMTEPRTSSIVGGTKANKITTNLAISERRRRRTVKLKEWSNGGPFAFEVISRDDQGPLRIQGQQTRRQYAPEKKHTCPVYRIRLPLILDYKLGRYEKAMIQNAIRALLIGCEVD